MQTFLPLPSFLESAKVLDRQRLGKQRVEVLGMLKTLDLGPTKKYFYYYDDRFVTLKTPWYNHPAVQMWKGYERELCLYGLYICDEWKRRGYKDTCFEKIKEYIDVYDDSDTYIKDKEIIWNFYHKGPHWLGNQDFHASHRAALLAKNYRYYSQFGWKEEPKIEYWWPTKKLTVMENMI